MLVGLQYWREQSARVVAAPEPVVVGHEEIAGDKTLLRTMEALAERKPTLVSWK